MSEQFAKAVLAKADGHETLENVQVGVAIAFDEDRPVFENRDVPADDHAVAEMAVRLRRQRLGFVPKREDAPFDRSARVRMDRKPAKMRIAAEIAGATQRPRPHVDK